MDFLTRDRERITADPIGTYLSWVEANKAKTTHRTYTATLSHFADTFPDPFAAQLFEIEAWLKRDRVRWGRPGVPPRPTTVYRETVTLKAFYTFCADRAATPNIGKYLPLPKINDAPPHQAADRRLVNEAVDSERLPHRRLALLLLADGGLRASEVCDLPLAAYQRSAAKPHLLVHGKGDKYRVVPASKRLRQAIEMELRRRPGADLAEPMVRTRTGSAMNPRRLWELAVCAGVRVGISGFHPHRWRHSFACWLYYDRKYDINVIQQLLGHESVDTTRRYLGLSTAQVFSVLDAFDLED